MEKRDYYKLVKIHWCGDIWHSVSGIIIKCYTQEDVDRKLINCGELWERIG